MRTLLGMLLGIILIVLGIWVIGNTLFRCEFWNGELWMPVKQLGEWHFNKCENVEQLP